MFAPLFLIAAMVANPGEQAAPAAPANPDRPSQVFKLDHDGHERFTVSVTIDGEGPFDFMIDTGAQATVLSRELADRLQLNERLPATLVGLVSRMPTEVVSVDGLTLGAHNFNIANAPLVDSRNLGGVDGILGLDGLQERRVLLDFIKRKIEVADARELGGNRGYEIVVKAQRKLGQLIITDALVDGVRTAVLVDTGAQGSVVNAALINRLRTRAKGSSQITDVNGAVLEGPVHQLRTLSVGSMQINSIPVVIAESPAFKALGIDDEPAMILGMRELKLFRRVAIDFRTKSILFDVPRSLQEFQPMYGAKIG